MVRLGDQGRRCFLRVSAEPFSGGLTMDGIGGQLRLARQRAGLKLREVEERSNLAAQQWGNSGYKISASWLHRIENEDRGLSATKLIVLAYIYRLTTDQMLALCLGASDTSAQLEHISSPNATLLLSRGPLEEHARLWLPDKLLTESPPEATTLLQCDSGMIPVQLRRGVVGRQDRTMEPMIAAGSIVLIDTQKRAIAGRKDWTNEFDRFCELDRKQEWLQLVPHQLSPEPTDKRWRYRKEVEVIGTIAALFTRRAA
jgi:transcriptional regulator with XRE-family HTH domain